MQAKKVLNGPGSSLFDKRLVDLFSAHFSTSFKNQNILTSAVKSGKSNYKFVSHQNPPWKDSLLKMPLRKLSFLQIYTKCRF